VLRVGFVLPGEATTTVVPRHGTAGSDPCGGLEAKPTARPGGSQWWLRAATGAADSRRRVAQTVAMSLDPRPTAPLDETHFRGILPVAGKACSVEGCEEPADAAEPQRRADTFGVIWYCAQHAGEARPGSAFPIVRICGAPADTRDDSPCGGPTTHAVLTEFDGVDGLYLVPLCERHATRIMNPTPGSS
jgi:hypothetical protein